MKYSKNNQAEKVVGARRMDGIILDEPCELGYHCPVCKYELEQEGGFDGRLTWSEYNGFLWCSVCNKDYPSCLCMPDIDRAIDFYLRAVEHAKNQMNKDIKILKEIHEKLLKVTQMPFKVEPGSEKHRLLLDAETQLGAFLGGELEKLTKKKYCVRCGGLLENPTYKLMGESDYYCEKCFELEIIGE